MVFSDILMSYEIDYTTGFITFPSFTFSTMASQLLFECLLSGPRLENNPLFFQLRVANSSRL